MSSCCHCCNKENSPVAKSLSVFTTSYSINNENCELASDNSKSNDLGNDGGDKEVIALEDKESYGSFKSLDGDDRCVGVCSIQPLVCQPIQGIAVPCCRDIGVNSERIMMCCPPAFVMKEAECQCNCEPVGAISAEIQVTNYPNIEDKDPIKHANDSAKNSRDTKGSRNVKDVSKRTIPTYTRKAREASVDRDSKKKVALDTINEKDSKRKTLDTSNDKDVRKKAMEAYPCDKDARRKPLEAINERDSRKKSIERTSKDTSRDRTSRDTSNGRDTSRKARETSRDKKPKESIDRKPRDASSDRETIRKPRDTSNDRRLSRDRKPKDTSDDRDTNRKPRDTSRDRKPRDTSDDSDINRKRRYSNDDSDINRKRRDSSDDSDVRNTKDERDAKNCDDDRCLKNTKDSRDLVRNAKGDRDDRNTKDYRDMKNTKDSRDDRDIRSDRYDSDTKSNCDSCLCEDDRDARNTKDDSDIRYTKDDRNTKNSRYNDDRDARNTKDDSDIRYTKNTRYNGDRDARNTKDDSDMRHTKNDRNTKDDRDARNTRDDKDPKPQKKGIPVPKRNNSSTRPPCVMKFMAPCPPAVSFFRAAHCNYPILGISPSFTKRAFPNEPKTSKISPKTAFKKPTSTKKAVGIQSNETEITETGVGTKDGVLKEEKLVSALSDRCSCCGETLYVEYMEPREEEFPYCTHEDDDHFICESCKCGDERRWVTANNSTYREICDESVGFFNFNDSRISGKDTRRIESAEVARKRAADTRMSRSSIQMVVSQADVYRGSSELVREILQNVIYLGDISEGEVDASITAQENLCLEDETTPRNFRFTSICNEDYAELRQSCTRCNDRDRSRSFAKMQEIAARKTSLVQHETFPSECCFEEITIVDPDSTENFFLYEKRDKPTRKTAKSDILSKGLPFLIKQGLRKGFSGIPKKCGSKKKAAVVPMRNSVNLPIGKIIIHGGTQVNLEKDLHPGKGDVDNNKQPTLRETKAQIIKNRNFTVSTYHVEVVASARNLLENKPSIKKLKNSKRLSVDESGRHAPKKKVAFKMSEKPAINERTKKPETSKGEAETKKAPPRNKIPVSNKSRYSKVRKSKETKSTQETKKVNSRIQEYVNPIIFYQPSEVVIAKDNTNYTPWWDKGLNAKPSETNISRKTSETHIKGVKKSAFNLKIKSSSKCSLKSETNLRVRPCSTLSIRHKSTANLPKSNSSNSSVHSDAPVNMQKWCGFGMPKSNPNLNAGIMNVLYGAHSGHHFSKSYCNFHSGRKEKT